MAQTLSGSLLQTDNQSLTGRSDFAVHFGTVQANIHVALHFEVTASRIAWPGGCTTLTPEVVSIGTVADARGVARITVPIPHDRHLLGGVRYTPAAIGDVGEPMFGGLGLSGGPQIGIGR